MKNRLQVTEMMTNIGNLNKIMKVLYLSKEDSNKKVTIMILKYAGERKITLNRIIFRYNVAFKCSQLLM